jgi:hypothetical protein
VLWVLSVLLDPKEYKVLQVRLRGSKVHKDFKERKVHKVHKALKGQLVLLDHKEYKE